MASLEQVGLASFVKLLSEIPSIAMADVDTFVRTYRDRKREGFIQYEGKQYTVPLNEESIAMSLKLLCAGLKLNDLLEKNYSIGNFLWLGCQSGHGSDMLPPKAHLHPKLWKWVELVHVWLLLDLNPTEVSCWNVVEAPTIRSGMKINWARFLMHKMHKDVLQRRRHNCSPFATAQYISKLVGDICPSLPLPLEDVDVQPKVEPHPGVNSHDTDTKTLECEEGQVEKDQVEERQA